MIIKDISLVEVFNLIDRQALFKCRWQVKPEQAGDMFNELWDMSIAKDLWQLQCIFKIFSVRVDNNKIIIDDNTELLFSQITGKQMLKKLPAEINIGLQLVTSGKKVKKQSDTLAAEGKIEKQFLLHGLAAEVTEGLAVWCNKKVEKELGIKESKRLSPGYPIWPELSEQKKIFKLLKPEDIGVTLSANFQMIPEYSTSAIVLPMD